MIPDFVALSFAIALSRKGGKHLPIMFTLCAMITRRLEMAACLGMGHNNMNVDGGNAHCAYS